MYSGIENIKCYYVMFVYQWDLSFSFVCVDLSEACFLGSFFIFSFLASPLSTVGLHCAVVYASAACVACADPLPYDIVFPLGMYINTELFLPLKICYQKYSQWVSSFSLGCFLPWDISPSSHRCND